MTTRLAARCRRLVQVYSDHQDEDRQVLDDGQLTYQAERAATAAELVVRYRAVVLDDPVGTGKTIVALAAAQALIEGRAVDRALVICPSQAVAGRWRGRAGEMGLTLSGTLRPGQVTVTTLARLDQARMPRDRDRLLVIVDEAHRGLQRDESTQHQRVRRVAFGAMVLLVTATPFQLSATGLAAMLSVGLTDGDADFGPLQRVAETGARALTLQHHVDRHGPTASHALTEALAGAWRTFESEQEAASNVRDRHFLPAYDRARMRLPEEFTLADRTLIEPPGRWEVAYHVARLIPELQPRTEDAESWLRNSDTYMRMLVSSNDALRASAAWQTFSASASTPAAIRLRRALDDRLGNHYLAHPKVAFTAEEALRRAKSGQHVLVFCYFVATPLAIYNAILALGLPDRVRIHLADSEAAARRVHRAGFGRPVDSRNQPRILLVGDRLSESIDLDGGSPAIIHHDLTWNPVRYDQRMGRVVRASSGFQPIKYSDVVIPVMGELDRRMYDTLAGRRELAAHVLRR